MDAEDLVLVYMQEESENFKAERLRMEEEQAPIAREIGEMQGRVEACLAVLALRAQRQEDEDRRAAALEVRYGRSGVGVHSSYNIIKLLQQMVAPCFFIRA